MSLRSVSRAFFRLLLGCVNTCVFGQRCYPYGAGVTTTVDVAGYKIFSYKATGNFTNPGVSFLGIGADSYVPADVLLVGGGGPGGFSGGGGGGAGAVVFYPGVQFQPGLYRITAGWGGYMSSYRESYKSTSPTGDALLIDWLTQPVSSIVDFLFGQETKPATWYLTTLPGMASMISRNTTTSPLYADPWFVAAGGGPGGDSTNFVSSPKGGSGGGGGVCMGCTPSQSNNYLQVSQYNAVTGTGQIYPNDPANPKSKYVFGNNGGTGTVEVTGYISRHSGGGGEGLAAQAGMR